MSHVFYNFDLGYCQGMNDYVAVLLMVLDDEATTFWCFAHLMADRVESNFTKDMASMTWQLQHLGGLLKTVQPAFWEYLEKIEATELFCVYRWLVLQFKREFSCPEIMRLWETLWSARQLTTYCISPQYFALLKGFKAPADFICNLNIFAGIYYFIRNYL